MKVLLAMAILLFSTVVGAQKIEEAPKELPQMEKEKKWNKVMTDVLSDDNFKYFARDPNYQTSQLLGEFEGYKGVMNKLLKQETLAPIFYSWIGPSIKAKWDEMTYTQKGKIRAALEHCNAYLNTFSEEKEDAYFKACQNIEGEVEMGTSHIEFHRALPADSYFKRWDPNTDFYKGDLNKPKPEYTTSPYRRIETFFYRRVKDGVSIKNLQFYIQKLLEDLQLPQKGTLTSEKVDQEWSEIVKVKKGQLHGAYVSYQYGMVQDSGRYVKNKKEGKWVSYQRASGDGHPIKYKTEEIYKKGKIIARTWGSYWKGKLSYDIWYDLKKQEYRFRGTNYDTKALVVKYQGKFFELKK